MARYRKIDPRIWNDAKFRALSDAGKLAFFMLLTHPSMTALGGMRGTLQGLAAEMKWEPEAFREAFGEVSAKGMAEHDVAACLVVLPNFLKYNQPESPNVVKAWAGSVDLLPECHLKTLVLERAQGFAQGMSEGFRKAFDEAFPKPMPNQEQEQEQEPKQQSITEPVGSDAARPADAIWGTGLQFLTRKGLREAEARSLLGKLCKEVGELAAIGLLGDAEREDVVEPKAWLIAAAQRRKPTRIDGRLPRDTRTEDELEANNLASLSRFAGARA